MAGSDRDRTQWRELFHEVVATNLCTGCAACVMACPRDVLEYDHSETYHPFNVELSTAADDCVHGQRAVTSAPGPARGSGTGRSSATRPCSGGPARPTRSAGSAGGCS
jgi:coenzyme F420 hydrogenase subunit beta